MRLPRMPKVRGGRGKQLPTQHAPDECLVCKSAAKANKRHEPVSGPAGTPRAGHPKGWTDKRIKVDPERRRTVDTPESELEGYPVGPRHGGRGTAGRHRTPYEGRHRRE